MLFAPAKYDATRVNTVPSPATPSSPGCQMALWNSRSERGLAAPEPLGLGSPPSTASPAAVTVTVRMSPPRTCTRMLTLTRGFATLQQVMVAAPLPFAVTRPELTSTVATLSSPALTYHWTSRLDA